MNVNRTSRGILTALGLGVTLLGSAAALAQAYPNKPIRIVVPFGPGSGTDVGTRLLATYLTGPLGHAPVIENKPGGSGVIGAMTVVRSAPDGYTFLMGTNSTHGGNLVTVKDLPYDPVRDFVPVGLVGIFPSFLVVHPSVPAKSAAELVAHVKANPGKLTYATGSVSSLAMAQAFRSAMQLDMLRVPYQSNPQGITDVLAGRVSMMFPDISSSIAHVRSGGLRALAVISLGERSPLAPDVPTINESVMPDFHYVGWIGLFAPAGTPQAIVDRVGGEVARIVGTAEFRQRMAQSGAEAKAMGPAEFRKFVAAEVVQMPKLLRDAGVKPE